MRRRTLTAIALGLATAGMTGCGNSRTAVPSDGDPAPPGGMRLLNLSAEGVALRVPHSWSVVTSSPPLLATVSSGTAVVAVWSYRRSAPPPTGPAALALARSGLLAAARRRDPTLEPIRVAAITVDGRPALELDALEHVGGQLRRVRSVHAYVSGSEVVLDAYAPPSAFHSVDHLVFSPIKRSLRLLGPGA